MSWNGLHAVTGDWAVRFPKGQRPKSGSVACVSSSTVKPSRYGPLDERRPCSFRDGTVTLTLGPKQCHSSMYDDEHDFRPDVDEPFQNRDDLTEYDPEAPVVF